MMRCVAATVVLSLAVAATSQGQPSQPAVPSAPKPTFGAHVELVEVDAVVTDKQGHHVSDLTAEDFEIHEHGRPQAITHFQYISLDSSEGTAPQAPPAQAPGSALPGLPERRREDTHRSMVFVLDYLSLSSASTYFVRRMLTKVVDEQMRPGDLVAILGIGFGVGVVQPFTNDQGLLHAAIDKIRLKSPQLDFMAPVPDKPDVAADHMPTEDGSVRVRRLLDDTTEGERGMASEGGLRLAQRMLGGLRSVVQGLRALPGRKSAVFVSEGVFSQTLWGDSSRIDAAVQDLVDFANQSAIVVYSLDPSGVRTLAEYPSIADGIMALGVGHRGLAALADGTGGLLVGDATQIFDDQKGYYLMGYTPNESSAPLPGQGHVFHRIEVKVKRPGLTVRSRRSFVSVYGEK